METNCSIHWIEIYPVDSVIHVLNNWGLEAFITVEDFERWLPRGFFFFSFKERPTFRRNWGSCGRLLLSMLLVLQIELKYCLTLYIYIVCLFVFLFEGRKM